MATRPPLVHSRGVLSFESGEWADDDPWDSASDEETAPHRSTRSKLGDSLLSNFGTRVSTSVPSTSLARKTNNSSSSIAFSYTHIDASSPPKSESIITSQNGWTMIRTSRDARANTEERNSVGKDDTVNGDIIVDGDILLDDSVMGSANATRPRQNQGFIRLDALEIVNGIYGIRFCFSRFPIQNQILYTVCKIALTGGPIPKHGRETQPGYRRITKNQRRFYASARYAPIGVKNLWTVCPIKM
jgi:hypothetical protein